MPTIASENQNNIRQAMNVYVQVTQLQDITLTVSQSGASIYDLTNLQNGAMDLSLLTDLHGHGFPLDGTRWLYDPLNQSTVSMWTKFGIRSHVGTAMTVTVSSSSTINALTLRVFGSGTITANSVNYEVREFMVIPVNARSVTMTCSPKQGDRIEIEDITPGITLNFSKDNIVSCTLDLESDLSIVDTSWKISSIEVQAYYPDDISEAVSNMGDGVPISYKAGYPGDYSPERFFYVSEAVTQTNNLITIKGEDASALLDDMTQPEAMWRVTRQKARQEWYKKMGQLIEAAGIKLTSREADPPTVGTNTTVHTAIMKEASYRDYIQWMMDMANKNGFYPRFIDAGIPSLRWSTPIPKWDIYKEDIGDYTKTIDRNINKIYGDDEDKPLHAFLSTAKKKNNIASENVKKGKSYNISYDDDYYYNVTYENGTLKKKSHQTLHNIKLTANKTTKAVNKKVVAGWTKKSKKFKNGETIKLSSDAVVLKKTKSKNYVTVTYKEPKYKIKTVHKPQLVVKGYKITNTSDVNMVTASRLGVTKEEKSLLYGRLNSNYNDTNYYIPKYDDLFNKSNIGGSFKYKGNPKMQPRDVFRLYEFDGETYTTCTIESIETTHEYGGMISTITYREGIY